MTMTAVPAPTRYMIPPVPVRRFSVDEYHQMIQAGFFSHDERFELLDGWITPKMVRNPPHDFRLTRTLRVLEARLPPPDWVVRPQCAVTLATSEPEPDLALVVGPDDRYRHHHPGPADIALVIEVADSSLDHDRHVKGPIYAQANLPEYWIVNLVDHVVEVYTDPAGPNYQQRRDYAPGDVLARTVGGQALQIPVAEILG